MEKSDCLEKPLNFATKGLFLKVRKNWCFSWSILFNQPWVDAYRNIRDYSDHGLVRFFLELYRIWKSLKTFSRRISSWSKYFWLFGRVFLIIVMEWQGTDLLKLASKPLIYAHQNWQIEPSKLLKHPIDLLSNFILCIMLLHSGWKIAQIVSFSQKCVCSLRLHCCKLITIFVRIIFKLFTNFQR